jgi:PAS domain S-box-containing protein
MGETGGKAGAWAGREDEALRLILEGTASKTGDEFFRALVRNAAEAIGSAGVWVTEIVTERRMRSIAFFMNGEYVKEYDYDLAGTPCEDVIRSCRMVHVAEDVQRVFPDDPDLPAFGAVSYLGIPLVGPDGELLGHLAALHTSPLPEDPALVRVFEVFALRAAAEYLRLRSERAVREREEQTSRLLESAMDAILIVERGLRIVRANPAAERTFGCAGGALVGADLRDFLDLESVDELTGHLASLDDAPEGERHLWMPGVLEARRADGTSFAAEATLSYFETARGRFHTLILRNVSDRLDDRRRIELLEEETSRLRETVRELPGAGRLLGESRCMREALAAVGQVAETESTVLILGETGTGKELVAQLLHEGSPRAGGPLVRVNCAAIPSALMESELFGHEKGAFTGASERREGRFALADGGTVFLDEIGEIPLELQPKLLRVLQEKEFEPLGSSRTRTADVRVVAATHRNLEEMVADGKFREDLFYRLNVFPLRLPPLRERGDDIVLLAEAFASQFAERTGRKGLHIAPDDAWRLRAYAWPGNVRELQNVIERSVILSRGDRLDLARAMPEGSAPAPPPDPAAAESGDTPHILRAEDLRRLERENLIRALDAAGWQVAGAGGAAELLGLPPSTCASRMKSLGVKRSR